MQLIPGCSKSSDARRMDVIVSVKRDRENRTSTNTLHEHEFKRGDRAQRSRWAFFNSLCSPFFIYSVPLVLPHQTLLMTQALRTSAATMSRR